MNYEILNVNTHNKKLCDLTQCHVHNLNYYNKTDITDIFLYCDESIQEDITQVYNLILAKLPKGKRRYNLSLVKDKQIIMFNEI